MDQIYWRRWRTLRQKVDAVIWLIDRDLAEEATLRKRQADKQTIHPRELPPDKRRALIKEMFVILEDTSKN